MSSIELLLVPGCTDMPDCRCGEQMFLVQTLPEGRDAEIRIYRCQACEHELRLTVWAEAG
jgi:predicted SprT family Zn-dependent metalloprotease